MNARISEMANHRAARFVAPTPKGGLKRTRVIGWRGRRGRRSALAGVGGWIIRTVMHERHQ